MEISLSDLKELIGGSRSPQSQQKIPMPGTQIVVLDRGFVYLGKVTLEGDFLRIDEARNIRVWGTTKGLGELVHGPTESTKLDEVGTILAPVRAVIHIIQCKREW